MRENNRLFVRKIGNTKRNLTKMLELKAQGYNVPEVYNCLDDVLDIEYIHGLDVENYLIHNNINKLYNFIDRTLSAMKASTDNSKDYTEVYVNKIKYINHEEDIPFTSEQLVSRLPKYLPRTQYHGDMTLENIICTNNSFCLIDPLESEYDSYIFDIAKMRQDLQCKWFLRNSQARIDTKVQALQEKILKKYPEAEDDNLLILMLLRVYPNTKRGDRNREFLLKEIKRLWR